MFYLCTRYHIHVAHTLFENMELLEEGRTVLGFWMPWFDRAQKVAIIDMIYIRCIKVKDIQKVIIMFLSG